MSRCLDGHPDDYRHLVRRYQPVLLAHLAGKLGSADNAEEAAQETFVRAYFKMDKLKKPESFFAWLLGIADRVALEQRRAEQLRRKREAVRLFSEEAPAVELSQDYALETAVAGLPEGYRQVVLLRYYGGLSCSRIAEQLDTPLGTVTKTLSRAYALLRETIRTNQNADSQEQRV